MSIKIAVIKTGQQIISKVEEMVYEEKMVGYFFVKPCTIHTTDPSLNKETGLTSFDIKLKPWIPLGKGERFPVPLEWVVTLVDPVEDLNTMYLQDILKVTEDSPEHNVILTDGCEEC